MEMTNKTKILCLPRLYDADGDLKKQWFVHYSYRDHRDGKMVRFRISKGFGFLPTKKARYDAAEKIIIDVSGKLKNGWNPFDPKADIIVYEDLLRYSSIAREQGRLRESVRNLPYYMSEWLRDRKPSVTPSTYTTYKSKLRILEQWMTEKNIQDNDVSLFDQDIARQFIRYLQETQNLSNNSVTKYLQIVNMVFNSLIDLEKIEKNPFRKTKVKRGAATPAKYFNDNILGRLKIVIGKNDPQLWVAALFQYYCFIRPGELRKLKIGDINFVDGSIQVRSAISKNRKTQMVVIPDVFRQYLIEIGIDRNQDNHFVITQDGRPGEVPVGKNYLYNHFVKIREILGLPKEYKFYSFKHTGAVKASKFIKVKDLQMQLRHHSLDQVDMYLRQMVATDSEDLKFLFPGI